MLTIKLMQWTILGLITLWYQNVAFPIHPKRNV